MVTFLTHFGYLPSHIGYLLTVLVTLPLLGLCYAQGEMVFVVADSAGFGLEGVGLRLHPPRLCSTGGGALGGG
jgi:hypothetical protein